MKTEVYSWRLSADRKAELEQEARREGISVSALLDRAMAEWLTQRRNGYPDDEAEQAAIRRRAQSAIGSTHGGDPTRAERASELVREIIYRKHLKESNAFARRFGRPKSRSAD
jgi:post-segregation antitoxin (ccd killing protein)